MYARRTYVVALANRLNPTVRVEHGCDKLRGKLRQAALVPTHSRGVSYTLVMYTNDFTHHKDIYIYIIIYVIIEVKFR